MKALRIVLTQSKAHYRKEESIINKMTYPLPPFSTVIGALHNACSFEDLHQMDLSIQGEFKSLIKQAYTDYCFLDSVMDDRGVLVKLKNGKFQSTSFEKVAKAVNSQGSSFRKDITIQVYNKELIKEYRELKELNDRISDFKKLRLEPLKELLSQRKKSLSAKKKTSDKGSVEFENIDRREKEIKAKEKFILEKLKEFENKNYDTPISNYQSLTTSLRYYEVLHDLKLIIHVRSDDETLQCIKDNIYNLKAIGRSEDFVDVLECEEIELSESVEKDMISQYSAYLNFDDVKNKNLFFGKEKYGIPASGTKYYINKVYSNEKGWRDFTKVKVVYASNYRIDDDSKNVYVDNEYIVNFN